MAPFRNLRTRLGLRRPQSVRKHELLGEELQRRATQQAADFISQFLDTALVLGGVDEIRGFAIDAVSIDGLALEFGVFRGAGVNFFADRLSMKGDDRRVYGFDSFRGLSEHWAGTHHWKGKAFDLKGHLPDVRSTVQLIDGWIDDTLPTFLEKHSGPIAFINVDMDTYAPAKTVLSLCKSRFRTGTIVLFDELICYPGWRSGEFRALQEELPAESYRWLAFAGERAALQII